MEPFLNNVYNIPLSCSFWDILAQSYLRKYCNEPSQIASVLFLVPNHRARQMLISAFIRQQGLRPSILPQIVPIAEIDDDEIFFNGFDISNLNLDDKTIISKEERLFLFTRMIMAKPAHFGLKQISLAQSVHLALELANLIDTAYNQDLCFDKLYDLVPEKYAAHWQETLKLLKIITDFWPQILKERNAIDLCSLQNSVLYKQACLWEEKKTSRPVVAAGITASFPAIVNLLQAILHLPNGEIYFSGVDCLVDEKYWNAIDESHPQFEFKELFKALNIDRLQIKNFCVASNEFRERLISEVMRPAVVSDEWRHISSNFNVDKAIEGISFIECHSQQGEAQAIALKMREILNMPEKTAALITYDRNLARRVVSELERFNIKIDDSAGLPLSLSSIGIFLRLIVEFAEDINSEIKFLSLLKHPLCLFHSKAKDFRKQVYDYELLIRRKNSCLSDDMVSFKHDIIQKFSSFAELLLSSFVDFSEILRAHIKLAEDIASSDEVLGNKLLWRGDDGKCAAKFITKIINSSASLGEISGKDYLSVFCEMMGLEAVRTSYGTHPRLNILGPIEAKLCHFDYVILGEINEGIWPKPVQADMWMSRPMKKDFGFSLPEKNIGILGADLCGFLASDNVILTRAERIDGVPMNKSRWLLRLETVLKALHSDIESLRISNFTDFACQIDFPKTYNPITFPAPTPPVSARPLRFSASSIDLLIADPYSFFAKYILRLYPLDDLDIPLDQRDYGSLIHSIIEDFNNTYFQRLPSNAFDILTELGKKIFEDNHIETELKAFWWPKFINTVRAYLLEDNRDSILRIYNEVNGELSYNLPEGSVLLTAKADRIDVLADGHLNIIDYKTGNIPTKKQVMSGHALQLLLEGLIAKKGHFKDISPKELNELIYWHLGNKGASKNILRINPLEDDVLNKCEDYLLKLISIFSFKTTPYLPTPIPKYVSKNRDYEHLSRIREWSVQNDGDE